MLQGQPSGVKDRVIDVSVCLHHLPTSCPLFFNEAVRKVLNTTWLVSMSAGMETEMKN